MNDTLQISFFSQQVNFRRKIELFRWRKTQTRDHKISSDPGPQNTFWAFFKTFIGLHVSALYKSEFWPIFLEFGTNISFCKSFEKVVGQKTSTIFTPLLAPKILVFGTPNSKEFLQLPASHYFSLQS